MPPTFLYSDGFRSQNGIDDDDLGARGNATKTIFV
jgi:hypothetical protein